MSFRVEWDGEGGGRWWVVVQSANEVEHTRASPQPYGGGGAKDADGVDDDLREGEYWRRNNEHSNHPTTPSLTASTSMTTRRVTTQEKAQLNQDETTPAKSNISPAVPTYVGEACAMLAASLTMTMQIRDSETHGIHVRDGHIPHWKLLSIREHDLRR